MNPQRLVASIFQRDGINFLLTNRIPRRLATRFMGWFSHIEAPLIRDLSLGAWALFAGPIDVSDARTSTFASIHDCFTRQLKEGARPIDGRPDVLVSPCDAVVGASGRIEGIDLIQAKGSGYTLRDLLHDEALVRTYRDGSFATLRLTSTMYHRFHAPADCSVNGITYISGDTWNVNPIALRRIPQLFCKNERVVMPTRLDNSHESVTLVAVAAILVASVSLSFFEQPLTLEFDGPNHLPCAASFEKGQEMGYFQHGSTIIVFATPGLALTENIREGETIRMGEPLFRHTFTES